MKCKDCKHFFVREDKLNTCCITVSSDGKPEYKRTLAYAEDYEHFAAVLIVSPEFGCVQFEQRV